jgi:hypothetical protein
MYLSKNFLFCIDQKDSPIGIRLFSTMISGSNRMGIFSVLETKHAFSLISTIRFARSGFWE